MPVPEELSKTWSEAVEMMDRGENDLALKKLRKSWDLSENDSQKAKTLKLAGDAGTTLGTDDPQMQRSHWRKALKNYRNSLKMDPKNKDARKAMNNLSSMMDANAISRGVGFQLMDEGNPTPFGLFAIVAVMMMSLVAVKVISDMLTEEEGNPVVSMEVSYVDSATGERTIGTIEIELFSNDAPQHVENFLLHSSQGNYDSTIFHRVIGGFMNQGGDIDGMNGAGGNAAKWFGYCNGESRSSSSACEQGQWTVPDEADNGLTHTSGMLAMAKTTNPHTGGSQFYIVPTGSSPSHLDGVHTVFGEVLSGMSHVDAINNVLTGNNDNDDSTSGDQPIDDVRLITATVM
ncbi:MAG: peptidylprolyl isomerase [Candidatus Thalassarchaeaceae archaeon]|tara:strand:+ start:4199 stop:5236 length:1038 start_codon:yes stop_codon:yes gene_type:complete